MKDAIRSRLSEPTGSDNVVLSHNKQSASQVLAVSRHLWLKKLHAESYEHYSCKQRLMTNTVILGCLCCEVQLMQAARATVCCPQLKHQKS